MSSYYPFSNRGRKNNRVRPESEHSKRFITQVVARLKDDPSKLNIIRNNLSYYKQQRFLKRGFLIAVDRFEWVFEVDQDVNRICEQLLADDYIGKRLRRYPLLFKGVLDD
ncbi:hypothetical protein ACSLBF_20650 (plasmid) [Pseudoalteromonas sp. T1lg65]|uniref:hypothetical protein n=1 Tax=Pseudoalteromonas sp. T1lg65 TaxID=2077101 RepID=UPI003F78F53B